MPRPAWRPVRERPAAGRGRIVYWRFTSDEEDRRAALGAVSRQAAGWRAIAYDWSAGNPLVLELGSHATAPLARRAVEDGTAGGK